MKTFDYIQDPGHGWIKVPVALLLELSIAGDISSFSYYRDGFAYLEEDCDAARFMNAYRARFGQDPKLRDRVARAKSSKIRSYFCYTPAIAANITERAGQ
jgi:hypothetical protein